MPPRRGVPGLSYRVETPEEDPGHAGGTTSLGWLGNALSQGNLDISAEAVAPVTRLRIKQEKMDG